MDIKKSSVNRNPEESANLLSAFTFWWLKDVFRKGVKGILTLEDIYDPLKCNESERLGNSLEKEWRREFEKIEDNEYLFKKHGKKKFGKNTKPSLCKAIFRIFGRKYIFLSTLVFIQCIILIPLQPILQGKIINYFDVSSNSKTITKGEVIGYASGLILDIIISTFISQHTNLRCQEMGMQVRVACSSLLYRKILRINKLALMQTNSGGKIINILSNDMSRFDTVSSYLHYLWIAPIQILAVTMIMWSMIGHLAFIGIGFFLLFTLPVQRILPIISKRLREKTAILTDKRVQLMSEFINGIEVIKMYCWEKSFSKFVMETRITEMKKIRLTSLIRALSLSMVVYTERVTLFFCIVTYAFTNETLRAEHTYLLATFFNVLQLTAVMYFLQGLMFWSETKIAIKRIEEFLMLDEVISNDQKSWTAKYDKKKCQNDLESCKIILKKEESIVNVTPIRPPCIQMAKVSANWILNKLPPTLCNVNLKVDSGQLCIVIGPVGAGKTSLLYALLKELPLGAGTIKILQNMQTKVKSQTDLQKFFIDNPNIKISYASQEPWLFNGSVKENILFGQKYDEKRYIDVTRVCALNKDFQQLPYGDMSIVGEKGIMLSGGQKARINLARAIYKQADIYLLDDPLSAVDAKVARHLFIKCISEYLRGTTRILATHQLQFLKSSDNIVVLEQGTVKTKGKYNELVKNNDEFVKMITRIKMDQERNKLQEDSTEKRCDHIRDSIRSKASIKSDNSSIVESEYVDYKSSFIDEQEESIPLNDIPWSLYVKYFRYGANWLILSIFIIISVMSQLSTSGTDYWLSYWTNLEILRQRENQNSILSNKYSNVKNNTISSFLSTDDAGILTTKSAIYIYTILIIICTFMVLLRNFCFMEICMTVSRKIHNNTFNNLLQTNMRFFHINSSGRILNRFSKDIGALDELLPTPMLETIQIILVSCGIIVMELIINYWIALPFVIICIMAYFIRLLYAKVVQSIKRYEGICRSPIFCHVNGTLTGLPTIRSSDQETQDLLKKKFDHLQDKHTGTWYLLLSTSTVISLICDILATIFIFFICFCFILVNTDSILGGDVGLAISQALTFIGMLQYCIKQTVEVILQMASVERVFQYTDLPKEESLTIANTPPPTWPSQGQLVIQNVYMRYNPNEPPVLKNLTVTIESGWKVGIVGRTGAGKSSLISAIFRLFSEGLEGQIIIDGIDTSTISLQELRSKISIIPQEPILFAASLRYNLDPFNEYNDETLWNVLQEVQFIDIDLNDEIVANGNNLSVGQKQLICLARSILRKNRIIVMDEATANIDSQTDELIQRTLRTKFADFTVLTIAHRLNTIIDSDRIIVMDAGEIAEFGNPYELLRDKSCGSFAQMVKNTGRIMFKSLLQQAEISYRQNYLRNSLKLSTDTINSNVI